VRTGISRADCLNIGALGSCNASMLARLAGTVALCLGVALAACSVKESGEPGGGTCPCVIGTGITVTLGCGESTCYELNGTQRGVACDEDGQHDDPAACTTGATGGGGSGGGGVASGGGGSEPDAGGGTGTGTGTGTIPPLRPWPAQVGCSDPTSATPPDCDGDGIVDSSDDCPGTPNADQADTDANGIGDACEAAVANCARFTKALASSTTALDFSGIDLRACSFTLGGPFDANPSAISVKLDGANLSCASGSFSGVPASLVGATMTRFNGGFSGTVVAGSFHGANLDHACLDLSATTGALTLDTVTFTAGIGSRGTFAFTGGDASGAQFSQNTAVSGDGTTFANASFTQTTQLTVNGGSVAGATLVQVQLAKLTSCDASAATLEETTVQLRSVDVDKMTCEIGTISCASGDTGTFDPSCTPSATPPACP
jgi:hypothetical protein